MKLILASYVNGLNVGLANYLKTIFSAYRINNIIDKNNIKCIDNNFSFIYNYLFKNKNYIYSNSYELKNMNFEDVTNFIIDKNNNDVYKLIDWRLYINPNDNINIKPYSNEWFCREKTSFIDLRYTNIPKDMQNIYIDIINKFEINDIILNNINNFLDINKEPFLGVHIRTWNTFNSFNDNRSDNNRYKHYISVREQFINHINKSKFNNILICTDNILEIQYIINFIDKDKKIIFYDTNKDLNQIQNAFIEILLLSKSSELIGSLNSTFTEVAWWYSKCLIPVKIL